MEYIKPQIISFDNNNLKLIIGLANSTGLPCYSTSTTQPPCESSLFICHFGGSCNSGPFNTCNETMVV